VTNGLALTDTAAISTGIAYDAEARPITVTHLTKGVVATIALGYNAAGQRARYTVAMSGAVTLDERFAYRDGELGQVVVGNGATVAYTDTYVYDPSGAPLELLRADATTGRTARYWYTTDGRGNVVALTDQSGKVVDRYAYDAWGEQVSTDATDERVAQQLRYGGYWYDEALGWYWVNVRYYDPEVARWVQPDPSEQDGVRTYVYVGDDPIDLVDPTGTIAINPCLGAKNYGACVQAYVHDRANNPVTKAIVRFIVGSIANNEDLIIMALTDGTIGVVVGHIGGGSGEDGGVGGADGNSNKVDPAPPSVHATRNFGSGRPPHTAEVIVTDAQGKIIGHQTLKSGNMTPEEAKLGFPRSTLATHTEARAVRNMPLKRGDTMVIKGEYAPCSPCKGAMNRAARDSGATIIYEWGNDRWVAKP